MINEPKTLNGCDRQMDALIRLYKREFRGGGSFGWDMPTFRMNSPAMYARYQALRTRYLELKK